ncbi:Eukaryotic translation initiation factor 4 gamma 1, partial [Armadillidium vulgare]
YWILDNQEGKRQYNREFLIQLSKDPLSMKRPDSLPKLEIVLDHTPHRPFETEIKKEPSEICCVVAGENVHFDAQLIRVELRKLFKSEVPDEEIFDWIEKNIGWKTNTKTFICTLTTALIESLLESLLRKSFRALYDMDVLIDDSFFEWEKSDAFLEWEKSDDPEGQFGKGVCLTSVKKFLDWLRR